MILYVTLESSQEMLVKKFIFQKIEMDDLEVFNNSFTDAEKNKIQKAANELEEYLTVESLTFLNHEKLINLITNKNYEYVIIDGVQKPSEIDADFIFALRNIVDKNNCTLFLSLDIANSVEYKIGKIPRLHDVENGEVIEENVDVLLFLDRLDYYNENAGPGDFEIIVARNRLGPVVSLEMHFNAKLARLEDIPEINLF